MAISTGASIGFRCKFNGEKGIISTAHTTNYTPLNPVSYGGINFGNIIAASYGGSVDFCFIKITNSNFTASRTTYTSPSYTLHSSNYVSSLPTNYTVYMVGANSSSARQGYVVNFSGSVSNNGGTNWLICSYSSSGGDSGGCIFAVVNGENRVVGIHDGSIGQNKYGTKFTAMKSTLNSLTLY